jgi:hypothetical protein
LQKRRLFNKDARMAEEWPDRGRPGRIAPAFATRRQEVRHVETASAKGRFACIRVIRLASTKARRCPLGWERTEPIETIARSNYGYIAVLLRLQNRLQ